ncbi:type II secretion system F family protein [Candidatus Wolfebacteria bacterium]|nr:type II secretion system F family protein [Candidatus Wolfebacteria bacterium]
MPIFVYKALNTEGKETHGEVQALDRQIAVDYLRRDNLTPFFLEEKGKFQKRQSSFLNFSFGLGISSIDKIFITRHLAAILKSGINLLEALEILEEDVQKPLMKKILKDAKINLERGQPLSMTFASYGKYFSPVFVGLVKAGEASGNLDSTLESLGEQLQRDYDLKKKVQSAMVYPAILLTATSLIVVLLMTFVMPRLMKALMQTKITLPLITRILISVSNVFSANPIQTVIIFLSLFLAIIVFYRSKIGKRIIFSFFEKLPVSGELIKKLALARFSITLRNLLKSGMPALESINLTAKTIGNIRYQEALLGIESELRRGAPLHEVFKKRGEFFPQLVVSVLAVGERTGTLERSLLVISNYYNEEVDRVLKNLVMLLEPLLLIIMGFVVAGIALSILLPIYQLVSSFR